MGRCGRPDEKLKEETMFEMLIRTRVRHLVVALALGTPALAAPVTAQESTTLDVPGLQQPVEILVDRWGISHIYAETEYDLFFAQGWNAARDRLFQLELWRRQATGTVADTSSTRSGSRTAAEPITTRATPRAASS